MLNGVAVRDIEEKKDDRGFFAEILRTDWKDFLGIDEITQISLSVSYSGVVRAWHRHAKGQIDYFLPIKGSDIKIALFDDRTNQLWDIEINANVFRKLIRVPGHYWHGYKNIGLDTSIMLYFVTNLYDYDNPDEERRSPDSVIDPHTGVSYVW